MPRYFLELSYCGTNFNGWQKQSNTSKTIQQELSNVLSITLKHSISLIGCGRTDTGVHAKQFYAHFDSDALSQHSFDFWIHKWNSMLPNDIAIHHIFHVQDNAHARYSAISRTYEYHIHQKKDPFLYQHSWYFTQSFNHKLIIQALHKIKQHQDFACFAKDINEYENTNCIVYDSNWQVNDYKIVFTISANRFLRNMVRAMVGTLVWVGIEKLSLENFENILKSRDRTKAGFSAPPEGLHLTKVVYPQEIFI